MRVRRPERPGLAQSLWDIGVTMRNSPAVERILARIPSSRGVILRYHSVNDDPVWTGDYMQETLVVAPGDFEKHVSHLVERYRIVSVDQLVDAMRRGRAIDARTVAITFDDGYEDNFRFAFPILRRHGATATFYVTTGAVADEEILWTVRLRHAVRRSRQRALCLSFLRDRTVDLSTDEAREEAIKLLTTIFKQSSRLRADAVLDEVLDRCGVGFEDGGRRIMMNWDEIAEMHRAGMTIGSHSVGHYNLPSLDAHELTAQVSESKARLEDALGERVDHFAYPNGRVSSHFDARVARVVAEEGFRSAVTSVRGYVSARHSPYCLPRLGVRARSIDVVRLGADIQRARLARTGGRIAWAGDEARRGASPRSRTG